MKEIQAHLNFDFFPFFVGYFLRKSPFQTEDKNKILRVYLLHKLDKRFSGLISDFLIEVFFIEKTLDLQLGDEWHSKSQKLGK